MRMKKRRLLLAALTLTLLFALSACPNKIPVEDVGLSETALTLRPGEHARLNAVVLPERAHDWTAHWSSSDPSVATVDENGEVTAVGVGSATVTVWVNGVDAQCSVTVIAANEYSG